MSSPLSPLTLILGTSSAIRRTLCQHHFPLPEYQVECVSPNINEHALGQPYRNDPWALTRHLAHAKADALVKKLGTTKVGILITLDQVAVYQGQVREKPKDQEECRAFLKSYASAPVQTVSTIVVTYLPTQERLEGQATATQAFHPIPDTVLDQIVAKPILLHCAGGFCMEEDLLQPYLGERVGSVDTLQGFPIELVKTLIHSMMKLVEFTASTSKERISP